MTHDCLHCADYDSTQCPESCYFGQLEKDLQRRQAELGWLPISYAHIWREGRCPYSGSVFREKQIEQKVITCGSIYRDGSDTCPYLRYVTTDDMFYKNRKLKKYHVYCIAEGRCRSMGHSSTWTGRAPCWCYKRHEQEKQEG